MKKKMMALALTVLLVISAFTACGSKETAAEKRQKAGEIAVGIAQDLGSSLDPYSLSTAGAREIMFNIFEGLYKPNAAGDFVPALATDYSVSDDGCTYTFTLREGVKFHNGAAMTADDVVWSYETAKEKSVDANLKAALASMESVKAADGAVEIRLSAPNSDFLAFVASAYISPKDYTEQETKPVGTGPFKYQSRSVQENVVFVRNEEYWGSKAALKTVTFRIYETGTALVTALDSGAVDLAAHLTTSQTTKLGEAYKVLEGTMNLIQAMYLNNAVKPFDDIRVRQALCYAVDVDDMLKLTADGYGTRVGSSIYPAFTKYFDESLVKAYPHDVEKAKALLAEAGYQNGFDLTVIAPSNYTNHVDTAVVLAEQLKAVGINATVQEVEWNTWLTDVYQGRKFQATVVGFDASTLTAGALLNRFVSDSSKNLCGFADADYDAFIAEASSITDDARRTELYRAAEKILSDKAANVYLQDLADFVALRATLTGYQFYPLYVMDLSTVAYK